MGTSRRHLVVKGRVQGVNFRTSCMRHAESRGVAGWVRNLPDGAVEVVAEGADLAVEDLVEWCRHGPPHAMVVDVEVRVEEPRGEVGFTVIG